MLYSILIICAVTVGTARRNSNRPNGAVPSLSLSEFADRRSLTDRVFDGLINSPYGQNRRIVVKIISEIEDAVVFT